MQVILELFITIDLLIPFPPDSFVYILKKAPAELSETTGATMIEQTIVYKTIALIITTELIKVSVFSV